MRTSQIFNAVNTLLNFTNTGFRTINPGDAVLLGYDGNVSAPTYRANFPVTNTTGTLYGRTANNASYVAGYGKYEAPNSAKTYRDFVYDAETDSLYGFLDGDTADNSVSFIRVARTNGNLNNSLFVSGHVNVAGGVYGSAPYNPSMPIKIFDNAGTSDIWMSLMGSTSVYCITLNGSTGAVISSSVGLPAAVGNAYQAPLIKVQNGYGVMYAGATAAGSLQAFSVSSAGAVTLGVNQPVATLGIAAGGTTANVELIPLGNTGTFLYFRSDVGTYGTVYIVTLNTGALTFTVNNTYALTAAQANYTGRDGSGFILSQLNSSNQIVLFQQRAGASAVIAGALTLLTYVPGTTSLTIGNATPIVGPNNTLAQIPTPTVPLSRLGSGAHSMYDGYNFYYVEANVHLKIPFTGTAITPQGIVAYSKAYKPLSGLAVLPSSWEYASNASPSGTAYIPFFFGTTGNSSSEQTGYWSTAEESLDNTFAYGVEIGIATTSAAKGATVTVAVKNSKLSPPVGAAGTVGALSSNGASIYVSTTQLYQIADFDLVYPRLPSQLQPTTNTLADSTLLYSSQAPAYKNPPLNFGPLFNGAQNSSVTKVENQRQSVFTMNGVNFSHFVSYTGGNATTAYALLLSFDGIFIPQCGAILVGSGLSANTYSYYATWDNYASAIAGINKSANWSFRNEFGINRYDNLTTANWSNVMQLRYQTKD